MVLSPSVHKQGESRLWAKNTASPILSSDGINPRRPKQVTFGTLVGSWHEKPAEVSVTYGNTRQPCRLLALAFVLNNPLESPACFRVTAGCPLATVPIEAIGKGLCVFRLGKAEQHEVAVIARGAESTLAALPIRPPPR
jgi:hypothetical protein